MTAEEFIDKKIIDWSKMKIKNIEIYALVQERLEKEFAIPDKIRDKIWNEVEYDSSGIILYERRPHFQKPELVTKSPIFKLKYHSENKNWIIFWMPSDLKWHKLVERKTIDNIIKYINGNKEYFWG